MPPYHNHAGRLHVSIHFLVDRTTGKLNAAWYEDPEHITQQVRISRLDQHEGYPFQYFFETRVLRTEHLEDGVRNNELPPHEQDPWIAADLNGDAQDDVIEWLPDEPSGSRETESAENQDEQVARLISGQRNTEPTQQH